MEPVTMEEKFQASGNNRPARVFTACLAGLAVLSLAFTFTFLREQETNKDQHVRKAAVAGAFYPEDKAVLERHVDTFLSEANPPKIKESIFAIMVPHAGYVYSGPVAAYAYKELEGRDIKTVILIGNSHRHFFDNIAVYAKGAFETPLGLVPVDETLAAKLLAADPAIADRPDVHENDHVLEVQLPFLQRVLKDFKIVPILFSGDSLELARKLADVLAPLLNDQTLIIASTDMSHYPPYTDAVAADRKTLDAILTGKMKNLDASLQTLASEHIQQAETFLCSPSGVRVAMLIAEGSGDLPPVLLRYANSGDTSGDKSRVVGYGAVAFVAKQGTIFAAPPSADKEKSHNAYEQKMTSQEKEELLKMARATVESYVQTGKVPEFSPASATLKRPLGAFVTLKENGQLRGCIGRFDPSGPLYLIVQQMAISAASQDPRFRPVSTEELGNLEYEISVLSPLRKIATADEIELGKHGVQVSNGFHHGVFLPQVATETGWSKEEFLDELCSQKAGLPKGCWKDPNVNLEVFTAEVFSEDKEQH
jgi:AmmeMemoRadiSam system protein B/AmmeMemoRadiSam system protein A